LKDREPKRRKELKKKETVERRERYVEQVDLSSIWF